MLNGSKITSDINSLLPFNLNNQFCRTKELTEAIGTGMVKAIKEKAAIVVPTHAGGTYNIMGLMPNVMKQYIDDVLRGYQFQLDHPMCKTPVITDSIAKAVSMHIMTACTVSIPTDAGGEFHVVGAVPDAIKSLMLTNLTAGGINSQMTTALCLAVSIAVAKALNTNAVVKGAFAPGGRFLIQ